MELAFDKIKMDTRSACNASYALTNSITEVSNMAKPILSNHLSVGTLPFVPHPKHHLFQSLEGQVFRRLTVLGLASVSPAKWFCLCECGNVSIVSSAALKHKKHPAYSCGCYSREIHSVMMKKKAKHGRTRTPVYRSWQDCKKRCYNPQNKNYYQYGGRGIKVCQGWRDSFENFLADMGEKPPKQTLDRIDNDANYSCGHCEECVANGWTANCKWSTQAEQANNTRSNIFVEYRGEKRTISQWTKLLELPLGLVAYRLNHGWDAVAAIETPPDYKNNYARDTTQQN